MPVTIEIKNRTNWLLTIILGLGLLLLAFIILIIIPLTSIQNEGFSFIYILFVTPFAAFFTIFLYFWLWNTFGKMVLIIDPETIKIEYKNKLFASPKTYLKKDINQIEIKDFQVKRYKFGVRYHFSLSGSTYSVIFVHNGNETRIIDWITETKASEITDEIKKIWY
ncbi:hypothetical protein EU348_01255 [Chryseobacterium indologenes]|uniref:PH domain-containing protein n=1 Tax=Chryseobacterium indologenes TaxID=253 RepID=A0A411DHN3_CHRID|nr:hypothetical protein EU348_01255 [Chryseobacterium indologenes]